VPDGVLIESSKAHKELRRILVEDQQLQAVVKRQSGVFKPYADVSITILYFTKTNSGGTDNVWFHNVQADCISLDDKRTPLLAEDKLGAVEKSYRASSLNCRRYARGVDPRSLRNWRLKLDKFPYPTACAMSEMESPVVSSNLQACAILSRRTIALNV